MNLDKFEQKLQVAEYPAKIGELVKNRSDFAIIGFSGIDEMSAAIKAAEHEIETLGLRCRVYTENRSAAIAAAAVPTGITQIVGAATAIGIATHNLATYNPDYEIVKDMVNNRIGVVCKQSEKLKNGTKELKKLYEEDK